MAELITQRAGQLAGLSIFADCFGADLYGLATQLEPLQLKPGDVLMTQGEEAQFFAILTEGSVLVQHHAGDGGEQVREFVLHGEQILGEIAMLRQSRRVATVTATAAVTGWRGGADAFHELIELPGVLPMLLQTARQRLAAFITPITVRPSAGTDLLLRPVLPGDRERASDGPIEFSPNTFYRRFMSSQTPSPALMNYLFEVNYVDHFVWVLTDAAGNVVADARFVRCGAGSDLAEVAFIVGDDYQHRGIGSFLFKALSLAAHVDGIHRFTARVLSENMAMRKILDAFDVSWEREDLGVVITEFDVPEPSRLRLPQPLADQISAVARQVVGAVV